jgi:steroid 5-alpha reductase family enzyme
VFLQVLWALARRHQDAGIVDVGWAASLGGMAVFYAIVGEGAIEQRLLIGGVGGLWGLRLASHLLFDRVLGKEEDGRYRFLREHWGAKADAHFLWFFQLQAFLAAFLSLPFLMAAANSSATLAPIQWAGLGLFVIAKVGETVADRQLAGFRSDASNRGVTCRLGLWRYSRHPNYFFEWLVWFAFAALAWPAPGGPWALIMPVIMYVLITRVSGIPYTEAQAIRSRGEDYRRYQRSTSPLIPWFPQEESA